MFGWLNQPNTQHLACYHGKSWIASGGKKRRQILIAASLPPLLRVRTGEGVSDLRQQVIAQSCGVIGVAVLKK